MRSIIHNIIKNIYLVSLSAALLTGCQKPEPAATTNTPEQFAGEMSAEKVVEPAPELTQMGGPPPVELTGKVPSTQPAVDTTIWLQLPDPTQADEVFKKRLETTRLSASIKREYDRIYKDALDYIKEIERPKVFNLSLGDALRRMLAHNYAIKIDGYAPAISTAQIVQAEAAFDMAFFANASRNNTDQPQPFLIRTPLQQRAFENDTTIVNGGIRKLLANGATATLTQQMTRLDNPSTKYTNFYPTWSQNFVAELRQPVLRNFGIDFNRAQINIRKNEREANREQFRTRVTETLNNTERAYWDLVAARRDVVISAELLAEAVLTLSQVQARIDFDAYQTLLYRSQAAVKAREFEYIDVKNRVRNAEDQLLNFINDPDLPLSADYEIIPIDNPTTIGILRDRFQAVQTALESRPEIIRARYIVDTTRIQLGIAKNQALPRLDAVYRMTLNGVGGNADQGFDEMTTGNFVDQFVGVEFAWNFGERAERAGIRIAKLQQSQAVVAYKKALDDIITDCRVALRNLETNFEQIPPSHEAVTSNAENLRSLQERQERKSPAELDVILNAQLNLAASRRALLQAVVAYNQGIVDVERAKGTLLEYDNVILAQEP
jgi:outer membrane protein